MRRTDRQTPALRLALLLLCLALRPRAARCANAFTVQVGPVAVVEQPAPSAAASAAVLRFGAALEPAWAAALRMQLATQGAAALMRCCDAMTRC
jgi:hypothetical protein